TVEDIYKVKNNVNIPTETLMNTTASIQDYFHILNTNIEELNLNVLKLQKLISWGLVVIIGLLIWKLFEITSLMREMRLY
ncbi:MAG: hypothetical protein ACYDHA_14705, partial [Bellilinea sp.]